MFSGDLKHVSKVSLVFSGDLKHLSGVFLRCSWWF